ncbi:MAG: DEAD/DEAH box helicase, partial [Bacilli bacterium]|nr:DEAD/DEAH box helicase [Bacilli bacterium]
MTRLNPIEESSFIEQEFRNYLKYTFNFSDKDYQEQFEKELDKQSLYKGPYLNVNLPFISTKSINELIEVGKISPLFKKLKKIDFDRKLYKHQEESLDRISNGRNVVITTGTGSGKTESFLYPVLNSILRDIENGNNSPGIRAILLYPMNALVNDQIERVREILSGFPDIKYGCFTGETPENDKKKSREKVIAEIGSEIPDNELIYRDDIRENPPHLLFTNYSMLEYLLIRPNDFKLFTPEYLKNWKFVIMDEAHTYSGALGIEVSLLLRRLTGLCDKKPNFLLTSATLGKKGVDEDAIISFAESLTSSKFEKEDIIFASRKMIDSDHIKYAISPFLYSQIENSLSSIDEVKNIVKKYVNVEN